MKKTLLSILSIAFIFSCEQGMTVQFDDAKSQAILDAYGSYMSNDMQAIENIYSAEAYVFANSVDSITLKENDLLLITGSLYLSGEFLNLN